MASTKGGPTPASASGATGESMTPVPAHREPDGALNDPMEADMGASDGDHETPTRLEAGMMKSSPGSRGDPAVQARRHRHRTRPPPRPDLPGVPPGRDPEVPPVRDLSVDRRGRVPAGSRQGRLRARPGRAPSRLNMAWQAAHVLKGADPAQLNDFRLEAHKAFRDANPGPDLGPDTGDDHAREVQPAADHRRARSLLHRPRRAEHQPRRWPRRHRTRTRSTGRRSPQGTSRRPRRS